MPKPIYQFSDGAAVDRACEVARNIIKNSRGSYETDQQCVVAEARRAGLRPSVLRRFLQPSRRPKEVGLSVWSSLCAAYRRQLERQLVALEDEIARLGHLEPDDAATLRLLDDAEALTGKIRALAQALPASRRRE